MKNFLKYYNPLHILDKKISFQKKNKNLIELKFFVLLYYRYGIGMKLINLISNYCGIKKYIYIKKYVYNIINKYLNFFFKKFNKKVDIYLKIYMQNNIKKNIKLYNYKGSRYLKNLPLHGQRRRSNYKTCRKIKLLPIYIFNNQNQNQNKKKRIRK